MTTKNGIVEPDPGKVEVTRPASRLEFEPPQVEVGVDFFLQRHPSNNKAEFRHKALVLGAEFCSFLVRNIGGTTAESLVNPRGALFAVAS